MYEYRYQDYPEDTRSRREMADLGANGNGGCEMHETYGWGLSLHAEKDLSQGLVTSLLSLFMKGKKNKDANHQRNKKMIERERDWTWHTVTHYHQCPSCAYISECREDFQEFSGILRKDVECQRCELSYRVEKKIEPTFGPLL